MISSIFFLVCICLAVDAGVLTLRTWNTNTQCQTTPDVSVTTSLGSCYTFPQALNGTQSAWSDCNEVDGTMTTKVCTDTNCQVGCVTTTVSLALIACDCAGSICVSSTCGASPAIPPRSIVSANIGGWYYLVSSKLSSLSGLSNYNVIGDVIVAAIGSVAGNPVKLLAYVKGNVAADTYQGKLTDVQVDAAGGTLIEALRYMGEYCETNDKSGYQFGEDRLIQVWPASFGAPWTTTGGSYVDANKKTVYYSSIVSAIRFNGVPVINHTCYLFPYPSVISDRVVSQYSTKCDLIADYGALWSTNATLVQGCPDNKRSIGIAVDYAAASFDVDVEVKESELNSGQEAKITFASGKLTAAWDNFVYAGANINSIVMTKKVPVYGTFLQNVAVNEQVGVNASLNFAVKRMYFTFGSKADGNTFYWDPTVEVSDPAVCQTCGNATPPADNGWIAAVVLVPFFVLVVIAGVAIYFLKFSKQPETA